MNNEKEIEEMATTISKIDFAVPYQEKEKHSGGLYGYISEALVGAGYGNVKQAVKEFAEKLKEEIAKLPKDVLTFSLRRQGPELIDYLITELYGTPCEACPNNNNAEYNERTCPKKGECEKWKD